MKNILNAFDAASNGEKSGASAQDKNTMKTILENFNKVEECGAMPANMPASMPEADPVSMSVNLNARGVDSIKELLSLMNNAQASRMSPAMQLPAPGMDMAMGPKEPSMRDLIKMSDMDDQDDEEIEKEEWDNSPEEEYTDHSTMIHDLSGGINREKKHYKAAQPGDNAMAVEELEDALKEELSQLLKAKMTEASKKAKPDFLDMDKDGDKKEPMKKAVKDKAAKK